MTYRELSPVAPPKPLHELRVRRVNLAFELFSFSLPAACFLAALAFFSWDTVACERPASAPPVCELRHRGLFGTSGTLVPGSDIDLDVPSEDDERIVTKLHFRLDGNRGAQVATTEGRARQTVQAHRAFLAGRDSSMAVVASVQGVWIGSMLLALGLFLLRMMLSFPRSTLLRVFEDAIEVEVHHPGKSSNRSRFSMDELDEVQVVPPDDGDLAHLVFVKDTVETIVCTGVPEELAAALPLLRKEIAKHSKRKRSSS